MLRANGINPEITPVPIIVIGTGGTGAHLIQNLVGVNETLIKLGYKGIRVIAYDGDKVSLSNIGRQPFIPNDYDSYKCLTLIERINFEHGFAWIGIPAMFNGESMNELSKLDLISAKGIIVSCVDTVKARRVVQTVISCSDSTYSNYNSNFELWMDIGNEKDYGQIIVGSTHQKLPNVFDVFPEMENFEDKDEPSCSVFEALAKQSLFINKFMATFAANMIKDLLIDLYLPYNQLYFNLKDFTINTK